VCYFDRFVCLLGGLTAVIYTDTLQTIILILGSCVLAVLGNDTQMTWL